MITYIFIIWLSIFVLPFALSLRNTCLPVFTVLPTNSTLSKNVLNTCHIYVVESVDFHLSLHLMTKVEALDVNNFLQTDYTDINTR